MKKVQDEYKETRVFELPNAIVRVRIPDLDDEENNKRMKQFRKAAEEVLRALRN